MRIAFITVAPPYRGGISKHSTILTEKLSQMHSVDVINYKRQYPDFLFPGKTQFSSEKEGITSARLIDSINPLNWFNTGRKIAKQNYDLVVFRFWNPFFAPALGIIAGILKRKSPLTRLMSLCDNILPHENMPLGAFFTEFFMHKMDGHLVQSTQTEKELHDILTSPKYIKRFHPLYDCFPGKMEKMTARKKLKIDSKYVILYFGLIREYKGFDILLKAITCLKKLRNDFHVIAAGECYGDSQKYEQIIKEEKLEEFITWENSFIPDEEVNVYFSAADIAALPYRSASQSGITQIAFHYDLPVIVSKVGGLPEIVPDGKVGRVIDPENPELLAHTLDKCLEENELEEMSSHIVDHKKQFTWDHFVDGIEELYTQIA